MRENTWLVSIDTMLLRMIISFNVLMMFLKGDLEHLNLT